MTQHPPPGTHLSPLFPTASPSPSTSPASASASAPAPASALLSSILTLTPSLSPSFAAALEVSEASEICCGFFPRRPPRRFLRRRRGGGTAAGDCSEDFLAKAPQVHLDSASFLGGEWSQWFALDRDWGGWSVGKHVGQSRAEQSRSMNIRLVLWGAEQAVLVGFMIRSSRSTKGNVVHDTINMKESFEE